MIEKYGWFGVATSLLWMVNLVTDLALGNWYAASLGGIIVLLIAMMLERDPGFFKNIFTYEVTVTESKE